MILGSVDYVNTDVMSHESVFVSAQPTNAFWKSDTTALSWSSIKRLLKFMNRYFQFLQFGKNN